MTLLTAGAGLTLALLYSASPLSAWVFVVAVVFCSMAGRGLPLEERRLLVAVLAASLAARAAFVGLRFLVDIPHHSDLSVGALTGDEAYYLSRALRARDIAVGLAHTTYDYFVATDEYGRTSYLGLLTALQVIFGPTPYSMRLLNALLFVAGATLLFLAVRPSLGALPAFGGLITLLFLPSLFVASVSLLKESLYFLAASVLLVTAMRALRARRTTEIAVLIAVAVVCVWALNDLRRGAAVLTVLGLATGVAIRVVAVSRGRLVAAAGACLLAGTLALAQPAIQSRVIDGLASAARAHAGHVFTVGHAYKLLDAGFYVNPNEPAEITGPQAARFVWRAAVSFIVTPLPWEMRSLSERAFLPEHLLWYMILALLVPGVRAGWKRDPLVTSLLLGYALPTAAALALTNGNVGTLLRLRGLVTPYLIWLSALGLCVVGQAILKARQAPGHPASVLHPEKAVL